MKNELVYGNFKNGVPYLHFGRGSRTLLFLLGGPGNILPKGAATSGFTRAMRPFTEEYTVYLVSRKSALTEGYSTSNMADDYAELIREDFGGRVDLIVGFSYGGLILQHFAAQYADLVGHMVFCGAAHKISDMAKQIDYAYASLVNQGKDREAMAQRAGAIFTKGTLKQLLAGLLWLFGKALMGTVDDTFRRDVLIEARAELEHDSVASLKKIAVPVLIVCGDDDLAFPLDYVKEMASLISKSTLKLYPRGHSTVFLEKQFVQDVRKFVTV